MPNNLPQPTSGADCNCLLHSILPHLIRNEHLHHQITNDQAFLDEIQAYYDLDYRITPDNFDYLFSQTYPSRRDQEVILGPVLRSFLYKQIKQAFENWKAANNQDDIHGDQALEFLGNCPTFAEGYIQSVTSNYDLDQLGSAPNFSDYLKGIYSRYHLDGYDVNILKERWGFDWDFITQTHEDLGEEAQYVQQAFNEKQQANQNANQPLIFSYFTTTTDKEGMQHPHFEFIPDVHLSPEDYGPSAYQLDPKNDYDNRIGIHAILNHNLADFHHSAHQSNTNERQTDQNEPNYTQGPEPQQQSQAEPSTIPNSEDSTDNNPPVYEAHTMPNYTSSAPKQAYERPKPSSKEQLQLAIAHEHLQNPNRHLNFSRQQPNATNNNMLIIILLNQNTANVRSQAHAQQTDIDSEFFCRWAGIMAQQTLAKSNQKPQLQLLQAGYGEANAYYHVNHNALEDDYSSASNNNPLTGLQRYILDRSAELQFDGSEFEARLYNALTNYAHHTPSVERYSQTTQHGSIETGLNNTARAQLSGVRYTMFQVDTHLLADQPRQPSNEPQSLTNGNYLQLDNGSEMRNNAQPSLLEDQSTDIIRHSP